MTYVSLLTPESTSSALQELMIAWIVLHSNCGVITQQPDFNLDLLPTLPEDQAQLQQHILDYTTGPLLSGGILNCFQVMLTMSNDICNLTSVIKSTAQQLDKGSTENTDYAADLNSFRSVLSSLEKITTSQDPDYFSCLITIKTIEAALNNYYNEKVEDDVIRFDRALETAKYSGQIEKLKNQISVLQNQINELDKEVAQGATSQIPQALRFGMSIARAASAETIAGTILLGAGYIFDAVDKATAFGEETVKKNDDLNAKIDEYRDLVETLKSEEQQMSVLLTIVDHVDIFEENFKSAISSISSIVDNILDLRSGLRELIIVDSPPSENYFTQQLTEAGEYWQNIATQCSNFLTLARLLKNPGIGEP